MSVVLLLLHERAQHITLYENIFVMNVLFLASAARSIWLAFCLFFFLLRFLSVTVSAICNTVDLIIYGR